MFEAAYKANRVTTTALSVTYAIEAQTDSSTSPATTWYKVTRRASKDYKFVDMSATAVVKAAAYKVDKYTRRVTRCISRTENATCWSLNSTVQPKRNECGSWDLDITVNEEDSKYSATIPADPATLFTTENARDYDEGEGAVEVTSTTYDGTLTVKITVSGILEGAAASDVLLFYDGERITNAVVAKNTRSTFTVTVANWDEEKDGGTVSVCGMTDDWEFTPASITLTSDTWAEAWEPPTSMLHLDMTATLAGSISPSDVRFFLGFDGAELEDCTDVMTISTASTTARATKDYQWLSTVGSVRMQAKVGSVSSQILTYTWSV